MAHESASERVALLTGAGSGLGAATARVLAGVGWAVAGLDTERAVIAPDDHAEGGSGQRSTPSP